MELSYSKKQTLHLPNAELFYDPNFLDKQEADDHFRRLKSDINWRQDDITVFGKTYKQPRLTALYGKNGKTYTYSGITMNPEPFNKTLTQFDHKIKNELGHSFNTVLLNWYRNGNDSNGWHADNEKELGLNPIIVSISLGEVRPFHFKHRKLKEERYKLNLDHGSLLLMKGEMQHHWVHQIAKTKKTIGGRINLTFRQIK